MPQTISDIFSPPHRPHPLARSAWVDRLNGWLEAAWRRGALSRPSLDPTALWGKALARAPAQGEEGGRMAEDVADFRLRLERLCDALEGEAGLNPLGRAMAHGQLARVIVQRLRLGQLWIDQPELAATPCAPPILVVGQMRAGTTRIHRLFSADPAFAATRFCDSWYPVPQRPDFRPAWSGLSLFLGRRLNPWLDTIHPFGTTRPDEELGWLAAALDHSAYEAQWHIPAFTGWSEARDAAPVYREFARTLSTDAAHHGNAARPRVMKTPQFAEDLECLLAQFPNARLVVARREAEEVAASSASLVANQMAIQTDNADLARIERECARKVTLRASRMDVALARFGGAVTEIDFTALDSDWEGEMERSYAALGLEFTPAARAAMREEQAQAARSPHRAHGKTYRSFARA